MPAETDAAMTPDTPTPDEVAFAKHWAAMQTPPVTVECDYKFAPDVLRYGVGPFWVRYFPLWARAEGRDSPGYKVSCGHPTADAAWSALAIALREPFASIGPVIAAEFAARLEGVLCPQCDAQIAKDE